MSDYPSPSPAEALENKHTPPLKVSRFKSPQAKLWLKIMMIFILILIIQIPLSAVQHSIQERDHYRKEAAADIASSWSHAQTLVAPILLVTYQTSKMEREWDKHLKDYRPVEKTRTQQQLIAPTNNHINSHVIVERRYRGLFNAPVYKSNVDINGYFELDNIKKLQQTEHFKAIQSIQVVTFINDLRGISSIPSFNYHTSINHKAQPKQTQLFQEGSVLSTRFSGLHANLPLTVLTQNRLSFDFQLPIKGSNSFKVYPVGESNRISMTSNWPHPSFSGDFLPDDRVINDRGFTANWQLTSLSSNLKSLLESCRQHKCGPLVQSGFGVNFVEPVSVYSLSDRAIKYALLFVVLTFAAFFLFEVLKALSIHPLQYFMVGMALSTFFLLLLALSEHISFSWAYIISAGACISLIAVYTAYILASLQRSLILSGALALIYTALYFILHSEDYAFVLGSVMLFSLLTFVMIMTRKLDWYALTPELPTTKN